MAQDAGTQPLLTEAVNLETAGILKNLVVAPGAAQGGVVIGAAAKSCFGIATETKTAAGSLAVQTAGVAKAVAAGVIQIATTGKSTCVVTAANGRVQALPTDAGTYYRVGYMHPSSAAAGTAGDVVTLTLDQGVEIVGGVAGTAAGTTNTPAGGIAATNVQAALNELDNEKADKIPAATEDNFASFDADGNIQDSGSAAADFAPASAVADGAITLAKLANLANARIIGRTTAGAGVPEALTGAEVLAIAGGAAASHTHALADLTGYRLRADIGPLADQAANATVVVKLGDVPTGRVWVPIRLTVLSGTTADATAQLKAEGSAAMVAAAVDGDTVFSGADFTDASFAAGHTITVDLVTAAGTGDLDAAQIIFEYNDLPA